MDRRMDKDIVFFFYDNFFLSHTKQENDKFLDSAWAQWDRSSFPNFIAQAFP